VKAELFSIDAEWAVLGAALWRNDEYDSLCAILSPEAFYEPVHARIWAVTGALIDEAKVAHAVTVHARLADDAGLKALGGRNFLDQLEAGAAASGAARDYAKLIAEMAAKRKLKALGERLVREASAASADPAEVQDWMEGALAREQGGAERFTTYADALTEAIEISHRAYLSGRNRNPLASFFGIDELDGVTDGVEPGELVVCAGRTGMGKSAFGHEYARRVARQGQAVLYVSLEMTPDRLAARGLGTASGVSYRDIRNGAVSAAEFEDVRNAARADADLPLVYARRRGLTAESFLRMVRRFRRSPQVAERGLGLVVLDHGGLLRPMGPRGRTEETTDSMDMLLDGVVEDKLPLLCLWQINREAEKTSDRRPTKAMLRDSGAVEQNSHKIWLLFRESAYAHLEESPNERQFLQASRKFEVIVDKSRDGPMQTVEILFDAPTGRFWSRDERVAA
jgi:replicative DNA helicase